MTFTIDTGVSAQTPEQEILSIIPSWMNESPSLDEHELLRIYAEHIISFDIQKPVKAETARKHLLRLWQALRVIGEHDPDAFDDILIAYADKVSAT